MAYLYLLPVLLPVLAGILIGIVKPLRKGNQTAWLSVAALAVSLGGVICVACMGLPRLELFTMTPVLTVALRFDELSGLFSVLSNTAWLLVTVYSAAYEAHDERKYQFYAWLLVSAGAMHGLFCSENLVTMYLFFEMVTLLSMPLILQGCTRESVAAALKYLFYSIAGAFLGLLGIFYIYRVASVTPVFTAGGIALDLTGRENIFLVVVFLTLIGFCTKAGMFPMHGWLPTAHAVAPAPVSALLSGVITKAGVYCVIRILYYTVGAEPLRGTWVQYAFLALTLITIFMGSMMAYKEKVWKKRLAYSTVSQVSYVLLGLGLLNPIALIGALLHVVFHSVSKNTISLTAGAVIYDTGRTRVDELRGIGREMPITLWCFTLASVTLIGIPPTSAFLSKWYLAEGALASGTGILTWLAPVILLVSALLTAAYLLPTSVDGFFPGKNMPAVRRRHEDMRMVLPMVIFTAAAVGIGIWVTPLLQYIERITGAVLS